MSRTASCTSPADLTPEALADALGQHRPTPEQSRVIAHPLTPLLVVAGAGSGKTSTMSQRVVHLVATGTVRADQVLGLTFTRKATAELAERTNARLAALSAIGLTPGVEPDAVDSPVDTPEPTIATYNAFAGSLVRDHGLRIGVDPDSVLITEARAWQIASRLVERHSSPMLLDTPFKATEALLRLDGALSENLLEPEEARDDLDHLAEFFTVSAGIKGCKVLVGTAPDVMRERLDVLNLVTAYRDYKRGHGLLDFGDQIALACRIAEEVPEAAAHLRAQYPAVLLDEFQDTSTAQLRLLSALFKDSGVTAVGDPHQAIYGWRGASAGALDTFHRRFNPTGSAALATLQDTGADDVVLQAQRLTPVLPLSTAWRNDRVILTAANALSAPLRAGVHEDGDPQVEHIPVAPLSARPVEAGLAEGLAAAAFLQDPRQEAEVVADFMAERSGPGGTSRAVLCRTRAQIGPVVEALEARGLTVTVVGLGGMLSSPAVEDVRAALTVAVDPERGDALMRLLTGAGIGAADLRALARLARSLVQPSDATQGLGRAEVSSEPGVRGETDARSRDGGQGAAGGPSDPNTTTPPGDHGAPGQTDTPLLSEALDAVLRWHEDGRCGVPGLTENGRRRVLRLARVLRRLRRALALDPGDLVVLAEQLLDLDIELAARPGGGQDRDALDALRDIAQRFAREAELPTLVAFLEWLEVAEERENGLEMPAVAPDPEAIQVLTIHAAKGLEWDVVAVIGLDEGVFPSYRSRPRTDLTVSDSGWMTKRAEFPHPLRADAATLPPFELGDLEPAAAGKDTFKELWTRYCLALGRQGITEERRLAYVALTRARHDLLLTGSHLAGTARAARPRSRFLDELLRRELVTLYGPGLVPFDEESPNPLTSEVHTATWPQEPGQAPGADAAWPARRAVAQAVLEAWRRYDATGGEGCAHRPKVWQGDDGAECLQEPEAGPSGEGEARPGPGPDLPPSWDMAPTGSDAADPTQEVTEPVADELADPVARQWREEVDLLLEEQRVQKETMAEICLPEHLAANKIDTLRTDPARFALDLRRPLPPEPRAAGRLGTVFHELVAQHLAAQGTLLGLTAVSVPSSLSLGDRRRLRRWLDTVAHLPLLDGYTLTATEEERELVLGDVTVRCRLDAVFHRDGGAPEDPGTWLIIDWKTGRGRVAADQLSLYAHAWAAAKAVAPEHVRAAYVYVAGTGDHGEVDELEPGQLLGRDELVTLVNSTPHAESSAS